MVVPVLLGSVRSERMGDRAAKWVVSQLGARGHEPVLVDAAQLKLPMLDKMWKEIKGGPPAGYEELWPTSTREQTGFALSARNTITVFRRD